MLCADKRHSLQEHKCRLSGHIMSVFAGDIHSEQRSQRLIYQSSEQPCDICAAVCPKFFVELLSDNRILDDHIRDADHDRNFLCAIFVIAAS